MILVDTSVWVDHLRRGHPVVAELLEHNRMVMHPMVLGELACGNLQNRQPLLQLWQSLDSLQAVSHSEALYFIEQNGLAGKGIGFPRRRSETLDKRQAARPHCESIGLCVGLTGSRIEIGQNGTVP